MTRIDARVWQPCSGLVRRVLMLCAATVVAFGAADRSVACAICFSGLVITIGQQLDAADQAVLAVPVTDGKGYRVVVDVKGDTPAHSVIVLPTTPSETATTGDLESGGDLYARRPAAPPDKTTVGNDEAYLLVRNKLGQQWRNIGVIGKKYADWLHRLAAVHGDEQAQTQPSWPVTMYSGSDLTQAGWRERLAIVAPHLEDDAALAAEIAYGEISRAPYEMLHSLKDAISASALRQWIDNPKLASRRSTYFLLLGVAGNSQDAERLQSEIEARRASHDSTDLAAMLVADLEMNGPQRVTWIETNYLADPARNLSEIKAALLALSVQGQADALIRRKRVAAAYRLFIEHRKPMAGFVAQELADWQFWDATEDYAEIIKSDVVKDPASHFLIVNYLQRSPLSIAKAVLRQLADANRLSLSDAATTTQQ